MTGPGWLQKRKHYETQKPCHVRTLQARFSYPLKRSFGSLPIVVFPTGYASPHELILGAQESLRSFLQKEARISLPCLQRPDGVKRLCGAQPRIFAAALL